MIRSKKIVPQYWSRQWTNVFSVIQLIHGLFSQKRDPNNDWWVLWGAGSEVEEEKQENSEKNPQNYTDKKYPQQNTISINWKFYMEWGNIEGPKGPGTFQFLFIPLWLDFEAVKLYLLLFLQRNGYGVIVKNKPTIILKCMKLHRTMRAASRQFTQK